jgi:hypothetical protein
VHPPHDEGRELLGLRLDRDGELARGGRHVRARAAELEDVMRILMN